MSINTLEAALELLPRTGYMGKVKAGIQIDVNVVFTNTGQEESMCDHNCDSEHGNFDCPARFTRHKGMGMKKTGMAKATWLLDRILITAAGIEKTIEYLLSQEQLDAFYERSGIHNEFIKKAMWKQLLHGQIEINLFGGNPEMHLEIQWLIIELKKRGFRVNLTTTGKRWMNDWQFVEGIAMDPPHVLALSLDQITVEEIRRLAQLQPNEIKRYYRDEIDSYNGQAQKAVEAMYVIQHYRDSGGFPGQLYFNTVLHRDNLAQIDEMFEVVAEIAPSAILNPYPDQTAFEGKPGKFGPGELAHYERFVDRMMALSLDPNARIVKRLPYMNAQKAMFELYRNDPRRLSDAIGGDGMWQCFNGPGAGLYVQIGRAPSGYISLNALKGNGVMPGGHLGCFWTPDTITETAQVETPSQVFEFQTYRMRALARQATNACTGCWMPRLASPHFMVLESGLVVPEHVEIYQGIRQDAVGF